MFICALLLKNADVFHVTFGECHRDSTALMFLKKGVKALKIFAVLRLVLEYRLV